MILSCFTSRVENFPEHRGNSEYLHLLEELEARFIKPKSNTAISFFAGCGGLCYGARAAGIEVVAACELEPTFCDVHLQNFPKTKHLPNDIREIDASNLQWIKDEYQSIDMIIGGPPCQGFSLAGKRNSSDKRNSLFEDYLNIASLLSPKIIVMENVRMISTMKNDRGELLSTIIEEAFHEIGYRVRKYSCNARAFGVPQSRERAFFIGIRNDLRQEPSFPVRKYGNGELPFYTFGDAVSDLKYLESGEKDEMDEHHQAVSHPEHVIRWLYNVPQGKSAHDNDDIQLRPPSGYNTTYKRQVWDQPAATVSTTYGMISGSNNVHPIATRALTTREALRLQSFPDSFKMCGKLGDIRKMIGNAVPPLLAYEVCAHLRSNFL